MEKKETNKKKPLIIGRGLFAKLIIAIAPLIAFTLPGILSQNYWEKPGWDFMKTGQIGDTIGGIAGPILSLQD